MWVSPPACRRRQQHKEQIRREKGPGGSPGKVSKLGDSAHLESLDRVQRAHLGQGLIEWAALRRPVFNYLCMRLRFQPDAELKNSPEKVSKRRNEVGRVADPSRIGRKNRRFVRNGQNAEQQANRESSLSLVGLLCFGVPPRDGAPRP